MWPTEELSLGHTRLAWFLLRASAAPRILFEHSRDHLSTESTGRKGGVLWTFQKDG